MAASPIPAPNGCHPPASARTISAARPEYNSPCAPLSPIDVDRSGGCETEEAAKIRAMYSATGAHKATRRRPAAPAGADGCSTSERKRKHQPADHDGCADESGEQQSAESQLFARVLLREDGKYERDEEREPGEQEQVAGHHFRPSAMSYTSMTTSRFISPATMM